MKVIYDVIHCTSVDLQDFRYDPYTTSATDIIIPSTSNRINFYSGIYNLELMSDPDYQVFSNYCKDIFKKAILKFLMIALIFAIMAFMATFIISPIIGNLKPIGGVSCSIALGIILSGYLCFLIYTKIPDYDEICIFFKNRKTILRDWAISHTTINYEDNHGASLKINESAKYTYEKLLQLRDLDNQLFWTRINMLIVFQGVLLGAFVTFFKEISIEHPEFAFLIIGTGFFSSIVLYAVTKGGSYWVHHWEEKLATIEPLVIGTGYIFSKKHHANDSNFKTYEKKKGYVSTRGWVLVFSMLLPIIWILIFICIWNL